MQEGREQLHEAEDAQRRRRVLVARRRVVLRLEKVLDRLDAQPCRRQRPLLRPIHRRVVAYLDQLVEAVFSQV